MLENNLKKFIYIQSLKLLR